MDAHEFILLWAGTLLEVFVLVGLFVRRRAGRLWTLPLLKRCRARRFNPQRSKRYGGR